jgi:hypothetical protein
MASREQTTQRFKELLEQGARIRMQGRDGTIADVTDFYAWALSSLNLIQGTLGPKSPHTKAFENELAAIQNNYVDDRKLNSFRGLFLASKADFGAGLQFNVERVVAAEVFGDFIVLAKAALAEGNHTVAGVLACAALEDALKRFSTAKGLDVEGKTMEDIVNALKSKGLVSGPQKSLLAAMPRIRNAAMHAEWEKLTPNDVGSVLGYVEQFLLTQFTSDA